MREYSGTPYQRSSSLWKGQRMVETQFVKYCLRCWGKRAVGWVAPLPFWPAAYCLPSAPDSSTHRWDSGASRSTVTKSQVAWTASSRPNGTPSCCPSLHCLSSCRSVKDLGHGQRRMSKQTNIWSTPRQVGHRQSIRSRARVLCCLE